MCSAFRLEIKQPARQDVNHPQRQTVPNDQQTQIPMDTLHHTLCLPAVPQVGAEHTLGTQLPSGFTGLLCPRKCLSQPELKLGSLQDPTWVHSLQKWRGISQPWVKKCAKPLFLSTKGVATVTLFSSAQSHSCMTHVRKTLALSLL